VSVQASKWPALRRLDDLRHNRCPTPLPFRVTWLFVTKIIPLTVVTRGPGSTGPNPGLSIGKDLESIRGGVITIGNFDGVHRGHAALLSEVRALADELGGPAVAVVMDPHPATILRPEQAPARLTWIQRRAELMDRLGIDALLVCETTPEFLKLTAAEFFQSLVIGHLDARAMIEGPNFFFGRDRGGDIARLTELCSAENVDLRVAQPTTIDGQMISSTRIRGLLEQGKVEEAGDLLGTPHRVRGRVGLGAKRGRQIGFPTANLTDIDVVVPELGVYGGFATVASREYEAAIHIGPNPTFELDGATKVEVHLLDFDADLYEQVLLVDFIARVRDIARFDSADRLVEQLDQDVETIRSRLAPYRVSRD
jgi:riboflavin kinase/FMN adenylyltransferase